VYGDLRFSSCSKGCFSTSDISHDSNLRGEIRAATNTLTAIRSVRWPGDADSSRMLTKPGSVRSAGTRGKNEVRRERPSRPQPASADYSPVPELRCSLRQSRGVWELLLSTEMLLRHSGESDRNTAVYNQP
jgi:hypothetical protein